VIECVALLAPNASRRSGVIRFPRFLMLIDRQRLIQRQQRRTPGLPQIGGLRCVENVAAARQTFEVTPVHVRRAGQLPPGVHDVKAAAQKDAEPRASPLAKNDPAVLGKSDPVADHARSDAAGATRGPRGIGSRWPATSPRRLAASTYTTLTAYDRLGRLQRVRYPDNEIVRNGYDPAGAVTSAASGAHTYVQTIAQQKQKRVAYAGSSSLGPPRGLRA
jgi:YD repeat-containing protein